MKRILKQFWRLWNHTMVAVTSILMYPFLYFYSRKPSRYKKLNFIRKISIFFSSALSGIFFKSIYATPIDWSKTYIICPNHASNLDVFAMSMALNDNFFYLGKDELLKNPIVSLYFKSIDIPFNRDSKISAFRAFKKISERILEGMTPVIFPEGKIGEEYPPILHAFKNGPFRLAIEHQIPIIPVTIIDNWKICWDNGKTYGCKPGISRIYVHTPIATKGLKTDDDEALKRLVYDKINSKLEYKF